MDFAFSAAEAAVRDEARAFCARLESRLDDPATSRGLKGGYSTASYQALARAGWLGLQIPARYGGRGLPPIAELIFGEELGRAGAPSGNYAGTVLEFGMTVLPHGTEDQRQRFLPRVTSGEIRAGHLYTEPDAGSDLTAIRTTAIPDGDGYRIRGLKTFASEIGRTDYSLLLARTDAAVAAERGLTMFILDNRGPGITHTRLPTLGGKGTHQAYLDDAWVPAGDRVGADGDGFRIFEAIRLEYWTKNQGYYCGTLQRLVEELTVLVRADPARRTDPLVRQRLAALAIDVRGLRWLSYALATSPQPERETRRIAELKVFTDTLILRAGDEAIRLAGRDGLLSGDGHGGLSFERRYRENVLKHFSSLGHSYARSVLAVDGLGLPPAP